LNPEPLLDLPPDRRTTELRRVREREQAAEGHERRKHRVMWQCVALAFLGVPVYAASWSLTDPALTPPVRALYVWNSNPAVIAADQAQVLRGLAREDLFTIVHEQVMTDTARYADVVLPATTFLEGYDVAKAGMLRMTTRLAPLAEKDNIRVNCLAPGWIATGGSLEYWQSLTPAERSARGVPSRLLTTDEIAEAVARLADDRSLAGRVLVWWPDAEPRFIRWGDRGYRELEDLSPPLAEAMGDREDLNSMDRS